MSKRVRRILACLLSLSLLVNSFPIAGWAQMNSRPIPSGGGFQPSGATLASGFDFYRWISSFPEFSQNPAFLAQVLIKAAPLIQKGPVRVSVEEGRIVLVPDRSDSKTLYIELPGMGGAVSESASLLAQELQAAQGTDEKEGGISHSSQVLNRFFERFSRPAPEAGAVKASVSEDSSSGPNASPQNVWLSLERWIGENLDLNLQPGKTNEWTREAAEILRNQPAYSLNKALAESFTKTQRLNQEQINAVELLFEKKLVLEHRGAGYLHQMAEIGGKLYAGTNTSLLVLEENRWKVVPQHPHSVNEMMEHEGKLLVASNIGLIRETGGKWEKDPALGELVYGISSLDGKLYAAMAEGVFSKEEAGWRPVAEHLARMGQAFQILKIDGKLHIASYDGLYIQEGGAWKRDETLPHIVYRGILLDGKLYVVANNGIYLKEAEKPARQVLKVPKAPFGLNWGAVHHVSKVDGKIYAAVEGGIYLLEEGPPRLVLNLGDGIHAYGIFQVRGKVYVGIQHDLWRWVSLPKDIPESWQDLVLKDIGSEISKLGKLREEAGSSPKPLPSDAEGRIFGEDGRTIFSGFHKGISLFLGMLGAGVLEGLSRLAMSLGGLNLGFGEEAAGSSSGSDVWRPLSLWIQDRLGLEASEARLEEWKRETVGLFRNQPGYQIGDALAESFSKVHGLSTGINKRIVSFLLERPRSPFLDEPPGKPSVKDRHVDWFWSGVVNNALFAVVRGRGPGSLDHLYIKEGGHWKQAAAFPSISMVFGLKGKIYVELDDGLHVSEGGGFKPFFKEHISPRKPGELVYPNWIAGVYEFNSRIYVSTSEGAYVREGAGWRKILEDASVGGMAFYEGKLYAGTAASGVLVLEAAGWQPAFQGDEDFGPVFEAGGRLYAVGKRGVYESDGERWTRLFYRGATWEGSSRLGMVGLVNGRLCIVSEKQIYLSKKEITSASEGGGKWPYPGRLISHDQDWWNLELGGVRPSWVAESDGDLYAWDFQGLWRIPRLPPAELGENWQEGLLKDIVRRIKQDRRDQERPGANPSGPPSADKQGNILDKDGWTLFSGFHKGLQVVVGLFAAGVLEGLSRLALSLGNLNLGFGEKADPWEAWDRWIRKELGIGPNPGQMKEWKRETAEILRNHPQMSLEKALAEAFSKANVLKSDKARKARSLVLGEDFVLRLPLDVNINDIAEINGNLYVAEETGLYVVQEGMKDWEKPIDGTHVRQIAQIDGKLYASTNGGLYLKRGNRWKRDPAFKREVYQIVKIGGKVYAGTHYGVYLRKGKGWKHVEGVKYDHEILKYAYEILKLGGRLYVRNNQGFHVQEGKNFIPLGLPKNAAVHYAVEIGGNIYASTSGGLYVRTESGWKRERGIKTSVYQMARMDGELYAATDKGLYQRGKKGWKVIPETKDKGFAHIAKINGGVYAAGYRRLYVKQKDGWAPLPALQDLAERDGGGILIAKGKIYVNTGSGLWQWFPFQEGLSEGWQERILKDIGQNVERMRQEQSNAKPSSFEPLKADDKGNILGEDGRTIFSGFQKASAFVLGILGAGALDGLSRLALSLGSLNLGFGEKNSIWPALERWVQESLDFNLQPGRSEAWKKETAEILRNDPALPLEKALAEAFSRVHLLDSVRSLRVEDFLSGKPVVELAGLKKVRQMLEVDGEIYAAGEGGIYVKGEGPWRNELPMGGFATQLLAVHGKIYAATTHGIYSKTKGDQGWARELELRWADEIMLAGGRLYASAWLDGLYVKKKDEWEREPLLYVKKGNEWVQDFSEGSGAVGKVIKRVGRLYAATGKGIYVKKGGRWQSEFADAGYVYDLILADGILYAASEKGIYSNKGDRWDSEFSVSENMNQVIQIDGKLYAISVRDPKGYTENTLYMKKGDKWEIELSDVGQIYQIAKAHGKLCAGTSKGLYIKNGEKWELALSHVGVVRHIADLNGKIYLTTGSGLIRGSLGLQSLPGGWKGDILKDIALENDQAQKTVQGQKPDPVFPVNEKGDILGGDGRTIFSGLQSPKSLALGLLSAGVLEGLSRLALSLGNLNLGFGEESPEAGSLPAGKLREQPDASPDPWSVLEGWLRDSLDIELLPGKTQEWMRRTAEILRNDSGMSLENALGKVFGEIHGTDQKRASEYLRFLSLKEKSQLRILGEFHGEINQIAKIGGLLHVATKGGNYVWDPRKDGWLPSFVPDGLLKSANFISQFGNYPNTIVAGKLYKGNGNQWEKAFPGHPKSNYVQYTVERKGRLYVAAEHGFYTRLFGRWFKIKDRDPSGTHYPYPSRIVFAEGKMYAATSSTIYERKEGPCWDLWSAAARFLRLDWILSFLGDAGYHLGGWRKIFSAPGADLITDVGYLGGRLYASFLLHDLYVREGNEWKLDFEGKVSQLAEIDGKVYMTDSSFLYTREPGGWRKLPLDAGLWEIDGFAKQGGSFYVTGHNFGMKPSTWLLFQRMPKAEGLPESWQGDILWEIGHQIEKDQALGSLAQGGQALRQDKDGNILGEDGRTIFSGLRGASAFLFGMLSAGALEGLSRLALSLGNLNLGFGEEAEQSLEAGSLTAGRLQGQPTPSSNPWPVLEGWIQREMGLEISGKTEEWKEETAGILRNNPALLLHKALALAYGKAYSLTQQKAQEVDFLLSGERFRTLIPKSEMGEVNQIKVIREKIYAAAENGLFIYDPQAGRWDRAPIRGQIYSVAEIDGRLYACGDEGLYLKGKSSWGLLLPRSQIGGARQIAKLREKLYLATDEGLYVRKNGVWEPILSGRSVPGVGVGDNDGKIYAAGSDTVYEQKKATWIRKFLAKFVHWSFLWERITMPGSIFGLWAVDGNLYSAKGLTGIFIWEGGTWKSFFAPLGGTGIVSDFAKIGDKFYVASEKGLFEGDGRGNWRHILASASLIANLEERLYLAMPDGLTQWILPPKDLPSDWQEKILQEMGLRIGHAQKPEGASDAAKVQPFSTDEKGNILGEDGRTIFSGLQRGSER